MLGNAKHFVTLQMNKTTAKIRILPNKTRRKANKSVKNDEIKR